MARRNKRAGLLQLARFPQPARDPRDLRAVPERQILPDL